jgi:hypothetical protein
MKKLEKPNVKAAHTRSSEKSGGFFTIVNTRIWTRGNTVRIYRQQNTRFTFIAIKLNSGAEKRGKK